MTRLGASLLRARQLVVEGLFSAVEAEVWRGLLLEEAGVDVMRDGFAERRASSFPCSSAEHCRWCCGGRWGVVELDTPVSRLGHMKYRGEVQAGVAVTKKPPSKQATLHINAFWTQSKQH